jgi:lipid-A-disaccharide synthase
MSRDKIDLPSPRAGPPDLLFIVGEHSGDQHAALAVRALLARRPDLKIAALGGPALEKAGAQVLYDMTQAAVVGLVEVVKNLVYIKGLFHASVNWIQEHRPRAVCFVDYPGFNLRLASELTRRGLSCQGGGEIRLLYYISPQIWAWKGKRRFSMARTLDGLGVIFPFELESYADTDLPVEFVGHPFLSRGYEPQLRFDPEGPLLLLPGSRRVAVERIFPVLLNAFEALLRERPEQRALVFYPDESILEILRRELAERSLDGAVTLVEKDCQAGARAVLTSSGTMSLSCALAGIPGVVAYRANWLTYAIGRRVLKVPYLGICNLLLKKEMYPEFIQDQATPEALEGELRLCLDSEERLEETRRDASLLREILSAPGAQSVDAWLERQLTLRGREAGSR